MDRSELRYAPTHEWVAVVNGEATVGITQFAVEQLTDVTYLELPKVGASLTAGAEMGVVESVKSTSPLYCPVAGTVTAVNEKALADTGLLSSDPFGAGWLVRLSLEPGAELGHLLTLEQYEAQIASDGH